MCIKNDRSRKYFDRAKTKIILSPVYSTYTQRIIFYFCIIKKVMAAAGIGLCTRVTQEYGPRFRTVSPNGIFIIYIPRARGIRRNIIRNDDISRRHSPIIPKKYFGLKKKRINLQNKQCKYPPFWRSIERGCLACLPRMIFHPIFAGQNQIQWSYCPLRSYSPHTRVIRL